MIKNIVSQIIEELIDEWDNIENKKKIQETLLDPMICYMTDKMYPYFLISSIIIIILFFLLSLILFNILKK